MLFTEVPLLSRLLSAESTDLFVGPRDEPHQVLRVTRPSPSRHGGVRFLSGLKAGASPKKAR
ncbi:hypothetical protein [Nonomuraea basaltis]|uniref:hypothetical protein n=1 Tax=Nonomuraea basaltis TaxID=2495887 RepID=UPI0019806E32|nr:hypothetical protein [Nonomuraea basaltis]